MNITIKKAVSAVTAILLSGVVLAACSKDAGNKVVIKGSTTVLPITQKAAEEYRKQNKVSITIEGSGSGNGIKALIDGTCDIANSSREMKEKELNTAKEKGISVKEITVAIDMIVPVINPANPVKNLSMDQLKGIYDGSIKNWKQVGGKDENIVVISRDTSSGTYEIWHEKVMKKTDVAKDALLQASNGAIVSAIAGNPKAVGYIGYGYIDNTVKPVTVSGIEPTLENGKSGKFPVSRKLYMYVDEKKISGESRKFIDYLLSPEGQKLVKEAGFISLN
ncbi:MAG TPA: PstS family phosphate ABC transporter substrate-binding protein [Spirochaetota bacterium]|nr:PstS family phosphate ABC transporter substrate-binding protein [Spirochaetota bacterium]HPF05572.1 PstS family phosphate ABC transporter substrate-binding protein [Spirochaetota bacterium]HPJ41535.1 PstS family phosphate ABC transporter substrate-binding protein [Spirochaetota bacterium]HPR36897.1 PstS family phosphate ABC transporter substrate-binding protein [Spirochaetota bacterium]HRX47405.1 PstS family phosphate ABC transporter substrate-binding protein [Spirochaetota bacterium]